MTLTRGTPEIVGPLAQDEVERVVRRHSRGFRYCYERELQSEPTLAGHMTFSWTIAEDGTVSRSSIEENSIGNTGQETCTLRELNRMRFPELEGGPVVVRYPFTFSPEEPPPP